MSNKLVYLDHAAATPVDAAVMKALEPYFSQDFYNPAATYEAARKARGDIDQAKAAIASLIGVKSSELILTSGGTEANNLAIHGVMSRFPSKKVLVSSIEHESVLEPSRRWKYAELTVNSKGELDVDKAAEQIDDDVVLISVMLANNEVGTIQPIRQLSRKIEEIRKDRIKRKIKTSLYLHTDACQAPLYLDIHPHRLGVDFMTINGGKIYGPKQSGALYVRGGIRLEPTILGGGQQRGLRSGTESPAAVVGLAKALEIADKKRGQESQRLGELQDYFFSELSKKFPDSIVNGSFKRRLPNNVHVTFPGADNERLINQLDEQGVMAAAGSACSASSGEPSHVLSSMDVSDADAQSSLRLTMGRSTTKNDIDYAIKTLASALA